jgi:hypothetical protein
MGAPSTAIFLVGSGLAAPVTVAPADDWFPNAGKQDFDAEPHNHDSRSELFRKTVARNKARITAFSLRGRHPPFNTAPVADSQRS